MPSTAMSTKKTSSSLSETSITLHFKDRENSLELVTDDILSSQNRLRAHGSPQYCRVPRVLALREYAQSARSFHEPYYGSILNRKEIKSCL